MKKPPTRMFTPLAVIALLCGCGVKAPPEPPITPRPPAPAGLSALVREGCVRLEWEAGRPDPPQEVAAAGFEVLRAPVTVAGGSGTPEVVARLTGTSYADCHASIRGEYAYTVLGISADARRGEGTTIVVAVLEPPPAPENLALAPGDRFVELGWDAPPGALSGRVSYNVYRAADPALFTLRPVNGRPLHDTRFADGPLENGVRYFYQVRTVIEQEGLPRVEGPAAAASAVPVDRIAPSAPQGLSAAWTGEAVELVWLSNRESDLAGYIVWRRRTGSPGFEELIYHPIKETRYLDGKVRRGAEYEYAVTALDDALPPNQSPRSNIEKVYIEP